MCRLCNLNSFISQTCVWISVLDLDIYIFLVQLHPVIDFSTKLFVVLNQIPCKQNFTVYFYDIFLYLFLMYGSFCRMGFQWMDKSYERIFFKTLICVPKDEWKSCVFEMTWRWANDDRIIILGWANLWKPVKHLNKLSLYAHTWANVHNIETSRGRGSHAIWRVV